MKENDVLAPEDYVEPRCLLCDEPYGKQPQVKAVPQQRIIQKMDEYMSRRDYEGAQRHLQYWLEEARLGFDRRGELMIRNELIGHFRKMGKREEALENIQAALALVQELEFDSSVSGGTTFVNAATACSAFGENERALKLFEKARKIYESDEKTRPDLLGGLYNNMALSHTAMGHFSQARSFYEKALEIMSRVPGGELEQAITYLNMADAAAAEKGLEKSEQQICRYLDTAYDLLTTSKAPRDGYYAFVCEKCAPAFSYHGYFLAAQELEDTAKRIYEQAQQE